MAQEAPEAPILKPIGVLRTPHRDPHGMPIQSSMTPATGTAELDPAWAAALEDLDGFDRVWLLWWADRAGPSRVSVRPFLDHQDRGLFATRVPSRPNPICMSCVRLLSVSAGGIAFLGADMLDGTPLLDIKPYVWEWDAFPGVRTGWYRQAGRPGTVSDRRFAGTQAGQS